METDFPAAHSMDTSWYAVDAEGQVALFCSGEDGAVPDGTGDATVIWDLWDIREPPEPRDEYRYEEPKDLAARLGLFLYEHAYELTSDGGSYGEDLAPYRRDVKPDAPLHVDQLPVHLREQCELVRFPLTFEDSPLVQPLEYSSCRYWGEKRRYLASDGQTFHALEGAIQGTNSDLFRDQVPRRYSGCSGDGGGEWWTSFGLLIVGLLLSALGLVFFRRMAVEWAFVIIVLGFSLSVAGGKLLLMCVIKQCRYVYIPTWIGLLILAALLILPIAVLLCQAR